jgi:hypothetical protein
VSKKFATILAASTAAILGVPLVAATLADPVYFQDTFDREADTFVPPWASVIQQASDRITTDSREARKGTHSVKFTVLDSDNPDGLGVRADLVGPSSGPASFCEGDERYIGWSILFPSDFLSQLSSRGWITVAEDGYAPYAHPPLNFAFAGGPDGGYLELDSRLNGSATATRILAVAPTYGQWMDIVAHYKFSSDPAVGYIEVWINGQRQTFNDGSQRFYQNTLVPNAPECGHLQHASYRAAGMANSVTIYQDEIKVGDSYSAVAP